MDEATAGVVAALGCEMVVEIAVHDAGPSVVVEVTGEMLDCDAARHIGQMQRP